MTTRRQGAGPRARGVKPDVQNVTSFALAQMKNPVHVGQGRMAGGSSVGRGRIWLGRGRIWLYGVG